MTDYYVGAQSWVEWVLTSVKGRKGLQPPAALVHPTPTPATASPQAREAFGEKRCFRTWALSFLDTFLSLAWPRQISAPAWASSPTRGHLGSVARGRVPALAEEVEAFAETTRAGAGNTMSLVAPTSPPICASGLATGSAPAASVRMATTALPGSGAGRGEPSTPD